MRAPRSAGSAGDIRPDVLGAADWLCLAAAPAFVAMAVVTGMSRDDMLCGAGSPLGGMTAMYLLMSAFHLPPWLKLIARRMAGS